MRTDKPFQKSFACAGILFGIIIVILVATGTPNLGYRIVFKPQETWKSPTPF